MHTVPLNIALWTLFYCLSSVIIWRAMEIVNYFKGNCGSLSLRGWKHAFIWEVHMLSGAGEWDSPLLCHRIFLQTSRSPPSWAWTPHSASPPGCRAGGPHPTSPYFWEREWRKICPAIPRGYFSEAWGVRWGELGGGQGFRGQGRVLVWLLNQVLLDFQTNARSQLRYLKGQVGVSRRRRFLSSQPEAWIESLSAQVKEKVIR